MIILFDVIGTLFSLNRVRDRFRQIGVRQELVEVWFLKLAQSAMAATLARKYAPFELLAPSTLRQIFALEHLDENLLEKAAGAFREVEPCGDARGCLRTLRKEGHRLVALSNSSYEDTERLLDRAGLLPEFERFYSADMVRACKPHPALYEMVFRTMFVGPYDCCMVSAHGWDILGAQSLGMTSAYVNRYEKVWPFPGAPGGFVVTNLRDVPFAVSSYLEAESLKKAA